MAYEPADMHMLMHDSSVKWGISGNVDSSFANTLSSLLPLNYLTTNSLKSQNTTLDLCAEHPKMNDEGSQISLPVRGKDTQILKAWREARDTFRKSLPRKYK